MKRNLIALCLFGLSVALHAQEGAGGVREIDVKGLKRGFPKGKAEQPLAITTQAELAKAFPEEDWQTKIKKDVDFAKEKLLFFTWSGSGMDKITPKAEKGEKPTVVFQYRRGLTRDLRSHFRLYALPKDAEWKVVAVER